MIYKQINNNTGELKFYGEISTWWISADDFTRTFDEMQGKFANIEIRVHCYGGDVFEGTVIANCIRRRKSKVKIIIDGVSASMMTLVMLEADEIEAADNAFVMVHAPSGGTRGTSKDHFSTAKLLDGMEKNFAKAYSKKTGKPVSETQKWMDGSDHWFTAQEALSEGLITSISEAVIKDINGLAKPDKNGEVESLFGRFAALLTEPIQDTYKTPNSTMKKDVISTFNLQGVTENSTDAEVLAALKAHFQNGTASVANALIASAEKVSGTPFDEPRRNALVAVATTMGVETLQTMLGITATVAPAVPAAPVTPPPAATPAPATPQIPQVVSMVQVPGGSPLDAQAEARKSWSWEDWQKNDAKGLANLETSNNELYKALYKAEFGTDLRYS